MAQKKPSKDVNSLFMLAKEKLAGIACKALITLQERTIGERYLRHSSSSHHEVSRGG